MALTGLVYGPMSAVLPELFPTNVRYSGSGVSFNIASILGAAVAPFIATWLTIHHGVGYVGAVSGRHGSALTGGAVDHAGDQGRGAGCPRGQGEVRQTRRWVMKSVVAQRCGATKMTTRIRASAQRERQS